MAAKKSAVKETAQQNAPAAQQPQRAKAGAFSPRLNKLHRGN